MLDTAIAYINPLGGIQTKLLTFTDRHSRLIGYVQTPGLGENSDELKVEFPRVDAELKE